MKKGWFLIVTCLLSLPLNAQGQALRLDYQDQSLNDVLLDLNERLKIRVSIDAAIGNQCTVTISQRFDTIREAMQALAGYCNLAYIEIDGAFTFYPKVPEEDPPEPAKPKERPAYLYQGMVIENETGEPVPYALMQFGDRGIVADENGRFSFKSFKKPEQGLFRSLGYELSDTTLNPGASHKISLNPALYELDAIEIFSDTLRLATNVGEQAGHLRFNDISNNLVPGLSNNLIFNNLRLYPGIMAAGEAITDFVIWGSYAGQNHVTYDDITLFNSWGINDDMGRINPYMIRNVEVYKGGFNVPYGDRIGGVVKMEGTSGNSQETEFTTSLTNQLGTAYLNLPAFNGGTVQVAARKTLFDAFDLAGDTDQRRSLIVPVYDYADYNLKLLLPLSAHEQLTLSTLYSEDNYGGNVQVQGRRVLDQDLKLSSTQAGASLKYVRNWQQGGTSKLTASYSSYDANLFSNFLVRFNQRPQLDTLVSYAWSNPIEELTIRADHRFAASANYQARLNLTYTHNEISLKSSAAERIIDDEQSSVSRLSAFVLNDFQLSRDFSLQLGLKADQVLDGALYWQPRVNARYDLNSKWNLHVGWGIYNQFISKNAFLDVIENRSEVWQTADGIERPVLESTHGVLGFSHSSKALEFGAEAFYKESSGMLRYTFNQQRQVVIRPIESSTRGIEAYVKKRVNKHEFSAAYTLMEVTEQVANAPLAVERLAPQSQEHEFKLIAALNLDPLQISLTTVYGSGFPNRVIQRDRASFDIYRRTDFAVQYAFELPGIRAEAGLSVLNLFNQTNLRLNQTVSTGTGSLFNTAGIPFTPTIYVNLNF